MTTMERFLAKVQVTERGCWQWTAAVRDGYGLFRDGRTRAAHRFSYEQFVGPIPADCEIDHLCNRRGCVNPAHLEAVTSSENMRRAVQRRKAAMEAFQAAA